MEAKVHNDLSLFLTRHNLEDTISQIDSIVLSYLIGILELIGQGEVEDCFDLEDVTEMMNAYLPGFDQISRDSVVDWMFGLAAHLQESESPVAKSMEEKMSDHDGNDRDESKILQAEVTSEKVQKHNTFPCYDFMSKNNSSDGVTALALPAVESKEDGHNHSNGDAVFIPHKNPSEREIPLVDSHSLSSSPSVTPTLTATMVKQEKQRRKSASKRKERYLSCSSQGSQEDTSKYQVEIQIDSDDSRVRSLLEMFPAACSMEVSHCLQLSNGDLDLAAQLVMDRQDAGQAITVTHSKCYQKKDRKQKKTSDYKLDDESIKSNVLEKYSFIDTEEDKKTYKPPPLKNEAKKLVRYRDGQIVSLKGERFSEVKKASSEDSSKK